MNESSPWGLTWIIKKKKQKTSPSYKCTVLKDFKLETHVGKNFQLLFFLKMTPGCPVHVIVL